MFMDFPGEKLVTKLWETLTEKGLATLLKPWTMRREARTLQEIRRNEMLMLAQTEQDVLAIRSGQKQLSADGTLVSVPILEGSSETGGIPLSALTQSVKQEESVRLLLNKIHLSKVLLLAEAEAAENPQEPAAQPVQDEWFVRWRQYAQEMSSDELQRLWGRILAGEVANPGGFSLRTLDFVRNLTQREAQRIQHLAQFVVNEDVVISANKAILQAHGLNTSFFLEMESLGLLSGGTGLGLKITYGSLERTSFLRLLVNRSVALVVSHPDRERKLELPIIQLSAVGKELLALGNFPGHREYMSAIGTEIKSKGFDVKIGDWEPVSPNQGQLMREQVL